MIPLKRTRGILLVRAHLMTADDMLAVELVVDTGATRTVLDTALALRLNIEIEDEAAIMTTVVGHHGMGIGRVQQLAVDTRSAEDLDVALTRFPHKFPADGLLGLDFLGRGSCRFDFDAGTLALQD